ncbi:MULTISPECIES: hypothetical protein [unclassified Streptomyces]|uniref:hypothetical protein n=1 Tax=unclassified Streptomyces TaxID=2593676 RepID=UPI000DC29272|nr:MULTISPECIES: hypothetical protein [unclassified Streptomyces]MYT71188.1 hypothetical protein [Streptomyces sp. SID8367]RAJ69597.1 hypothetical protein K377_07991 [Streptomyces sp. PsTaAH-137]
MTTTAVPFTETETYRLKCQSEEATAAMAQASVTGRTGWHQIGTEMLWCHLTIQADGSEQIRSVVVSNPAGCPIALVTPLDRNGDAWLWSPIADTYENTAQPDLSSAIAGARLEAITRGAWAVTEQEDVYAAYRDNPRRAACKHCGH